MQPGKIRAGMRKNDHLKHAIAETLKELRKEKGWTQEKLSFESRVDRSLIARLETGSHIPSVDTFYSLALAFQLSFPQMAQLVDNHMGTIDHEEGDPARSA
jgi:transcriptional regulator with XRE-family HTH domain